MPASAAIFDMAAVASVSTALTMMASTLDGDEILDLALLLGHVVLCVFDLQRHAIQRLGIVLHAIAQNGQEVVIELRHRDADICRKRGTAHQG